MRAPQDLISTRPTPSISNPTSSTCLFTIGRQPHVSLKAANPSVPRINAELSVPGSLKGVWPPRPLGILGLLTGKASG
jgi:hypothetical protein